MLLTYVVEGDPTRLALGARCRLANTLINTSSGDVAIGDDTIFGYNCMLLTGRHEFENGTRKSMTGSAEVPVTGHDIRIGRGCWIASGAIITGGVTIGDSVIVAAGSVVTKNVPDGSFVAGVPAAIKNPSAHHPSQVRNS
jgi:acetyltransferase-like isoleucine patch superfamily enzyme